MHHVNNKYRELERDIFSYNTKVDKFLLGLCIQGFKLFFIINNSARTIQ